MHLRRLQPLVSRQTKPRNVIGVLVVACLTQGILKYSKAPKLNLLRLAICIGTPLLVRSITSRRKLPEEHGETFEERYKLSPDHSLQRHIPDMKVTPAVTVIVTSALIELALTTHPAYHRRLICSLIITASLYIDYNVIKYLYLKDVLDYPERLEESDRIRKKIRTLPKPEIRLPARNVNHSHPMAAARRRAWRKYIDELANQLDVQVWDIQGHANDRQHYYYSPADTKVERREGATPIGRHLLVLQDTDYHVDYLETLLIDAFECNDCSGIVIATFLPNALAGVSDEGHYYPSANSRLRFIVPGGSVYEHSLWNYGTDSVAVYKNGWVKYVFLVERVDFGEHHYVIVLTPQMAVYYTMPCEMLSRMNWTLTMYELARQDFYTNDGAVISLANLGHEAEHVTLTAVSFAILKGKACGPKNKPWFKDILSVVEKDPVANAQAQRGDLKTRHEHMAAVLCTWINNDMLDPRLRLSTKHFHAVSQGTYIPDGPAMCNQHAPPGSLTKFPAIIPAAAVAKGENSDRDVVVNLDEKRNDTKPPKSYNVFMKDYIDYISSQLKVSTTMTMGEVYDQLPKAKQRGVLDSMRGSDFRYSVAFSKGFVKSEGLTKGKTRAIMDPNPAHKFLLSTFTYALNPSSLSFYAFGKSPSDIERRVESIAANCGDNKVISTDYSSWDAKLSPYLFDFETRLLKSLFPESEHPLISSIRNAVRDSRPRFNDYVAEKSSARKSGCPTTAMFNTLTNAALAYCMYRRMKLNHHDAINRINNSCFFGGDDGLMTVPADQLAVVTEVANHFGLIIKLEKVMDPLDTFPFLGRLYPRAANGMGSVIDVKRQLAKLPFTFSTDDPDMGLQRKLASYAVTDPDTPVIKEIIKAYHNEKLEGADPDTYWANQSLATGKVFKQPPEEASAPVVAELLNLTGPELAQLRASILARQPLTIQPPVELPGGEVYWEQ